MLYWYYFVIWKLRLCGDKFSYRSFTQPTKYNALLSLWSLK